MDQLDTWLYGSRSAIADGQEAAVAQIVALSRARNKALAVTGALIFTGSYFAQYVEGPSAGLTLLKDSIIRDARHDDVRTLGGGTIRTRRFSDWSLAYACDSIPFGQLIALAREMPGDGGEKLLMEMIRRFREAA